jgi:hypothetical protein
MKRIRRLSGLLLGSGLFLAGFGSQVQGVDVKPQTTAPIVPPSTTTPKASPLPPSPGSKLRIIAVGAQPGQTLRYQPIVGAQQTLIGKLSLTASVSALGNPLSSPQIPDIVIQIDSKVSQVAANGDITYQLKYSKIDAEGQLTGTAATLRDRLKKTIEGAMGEFVMDSQGARKSGSLQLPNPKDEMAQTLANQLTQVLDNLNVPLPNDPTGIAGEWQTTTQIPVRITAGRSTQITQVSTYKLVGLKDGVAEFTVSLEQTGDGSEIPIPTIGGVKVQLKGIKSDGSGQMKVSLKQVLPSTVSLSVKTNAQIETAPGSSPLPIPIALDANSNALLRLGESPKVSELPTVPPRTLPQPALPKS